MKRASCEVAIIGSGFGGSVCALRAAEAGRDVIVLERGPRVGEGFFDQLASRRRPFFCSHDRQGPLELHRLTGLTALTGNAVGGGSQVYTAVTVPAPPQIINEHWPSTLNYNALLPQIEKVSRVISPTPIVRPLARTRALADAGRIMGRGVPRLPVAIEWPDEFALVESPPPAVGVERELAIWLRGGHATRKRTLDRTYLARAETAGAVIQPLHEAVAIEPDRKEFRLHYREFHRDHWIDGTIKARRVVIAAGTLNTLRLLLTCRDRFGILPALSPALGRRFFTNGDFGAALIGPRIARDSGPPVTAWIDCWKDDRLFLMELNTLPPLPWIARQALQIYTGNIDLGTPGGGVWIIGVMGLDETPRTIRLSAMGRTECVGASTADSRFHQRTIERLHDLAAALNARLVLPPAAFFNSENVTVHPLGGACMCDDPLRGVVDAGGEVHGYPGLFIADGSILPTPIGAAPSMTIAALAEHVSGFIVS